MEHIDYVYTEGIDDEEVDSLLRERGHGVLALADDDDSYAVPLNYLYDGSHLVIRVSERPASHKVEFIDATETATFVVYDVEADDGTWSIIVRGPIRRLSEDEQQAFTDQIINETFPPFRLFGEDVDAVEMVMYELDPAEITGRRTME